ncbi:hypothetical protein QTP88_016589 [Uroleucon formosanum]
MGVFVRQRPSIYLLLTVTVFLVSNSRVTTANPLAIAKGAMSILAPIMNSYLAHLREVKEAESIRLRVWMHNGDPKLHGCGFYARVDGFSGGSGEGWFPDIGEYVRLGNEQAKKIELHADGWHNTHINVLCIGLNERTIAGGPRAFCINNDILKSCKSLQNKWDHINIDFNDMMFTRTTRGAHKIIFYEIPELINAFDKFNSEPDNKVLQTICDKIDLVKGTYKDDQWDCSARKVGMFLMKNDIERSFDNKNPYGCWRTPLPGFF